MSLVKSAIHNMGAANDHVEVVVKNTVEVFALTVFFVLRNYFCISFKFALVTKSNDDRFS